MGESIPDFIAGWFAGKQNLCDVCTHIPHHLSTSVTVNQLHVFCLRLVSVLLHIGCAGVIAGQPADTVKVLILLSSLL